MPVDGTLRVMTVVGTRPEIIRLSCTIARLDATFQHTLVHTGQNDDRELNEGIFDDLGLRPPDRHLDSDTSTLGKVLGGILIGMEKALLDVRPDAVLVLGDTNSCISAVMAKRLQIPVYHMEAGNRCYDANVPEEVNRRLVDHVADFNLVYTEQARRNLVAEGLASRRIVLTGSPMGEVLDHYRAEVETSTALEALQLEPGGYVLVSAHREETVDDPARLSTLVATLEDVACEFDRPVLVSTHPRTRLRLERAGARPTDAIRFHRPFGFFDYVRLQRDAFCVLSDSGTISEESAILGFPAVTLRDAIERPEALETGAMITTGLESPVVREAIRQMLDQRHAGESPPVPPEYAIRNCSQRVVNFIRSTVHVHHSWAGIRRRAVP